MWLEETFKDKDKNLEDPTSHKIQIFDPTGTLKKEDTSNFVKVSLGIWYYRYDIPENGKVGTWKWIWIGTFADGSKSKESHTFKVEEP